VAHALLISTATAARDFYWDEYARIKRCVAKDAFKIHTTTDDPDVADVIVFFEPDDPYLARDVRSHPYTQRYPDKTFLFDPSDRIIPFLPGIYASVQRHQYDRSRVRSGFFPVVCDHDWITSDPDGRPPELLLSFMGDVSGHPVREAIATLRHPRALIREPVTIRRMPMGIPLHSTSAFIGTLPTPSSTAGSPYAREAPEPRPSDCSRR